jgi:hypothetical protein
MTRRPWRHIAAWAAAGAVLIAGCGRLAGTPAASGGASPSPASVTTPDLPSDAATIGADLDAIRTALLGPSPIPEGWEATVDGIMAKVEDALGHLRLPPIAGLPADTATCATWQPLVGRMGWASGALLERQVILAHLAQLVDVAPDQIRADAAEALRVVSTAVTEQLAPDGDPAVIGTAPREELRRVGLWALENCEMPIEADDAPDIRDWTEDEIAFSCELDRSLLERALQEFHDGPGDGRCAAHPHELEITLDGFVYPAWHRIASVDNEATPPTFRVEPIPASFCDR